MKKAIIVFQKFPSPGKVKTRLAATIGNEKAVFIYTYLLNYTHKLLSSIKADVLIFHEGPIDTKQYAKDNYSFYPQTGKDLGEKMSQAFDQAFTEGYEHVIIIGTDCIELRLRHIEEAFACLANNDLILGPAEDGGYYLIGLNKNDGQLFENIAWSSDSVFANTIAIATEKQLKVHLLECLNDIDEYSDLSDQLIALISETDSK
ncbi:TIGR04282 family arsenosugar biosynthesis glycosyltransferase [Cyclobacterium sp. 1_MG-2023]|uniref:TIGR04282 family arsenosugar biosynthesis glycosyltransferase n=1 Tax=Cyclobacterium sp. 1_MG-2023 TaxID=3062681 RepID=UPI0026E3843F|nr:TIGR04282 family arsenosugar biosynthesis glycosyltransferase [Cyclobacterium sp. 1_MG-2023]MDO6437998.1 TIGR04282 family arsenosugar biosynthesis glycosyltransferase [Cyclobacterium sp. 1_MG-2023]